MQELEECNRVLGEIAEIMAQKTGRKGGFEKEAKLMGYFTRLEILVNALPQCPREPRGNETPKRYTEKQPSNLEDKGCSRRGCERGSERESENNGSEISAYINGKYKFSREETTEKENERENERENEKSNVNTNSNTIRSRMQRHLVVVKRVVDLLLRCPEHRHFDCLLLLVSSYI